MSDSNETLSLAPEQPPTMDVSHETEDKPSRLSLDLTKDFSEFLSDDTDTDVDTDSPSADSTMSVTCDDNGATLSTGTIVEVIHSEGSSPNIVIEDYAISDSGSSSYLSDSDSDMSFDERRAGTGLLKVPPMSWVAPRGPMDTPLVAYSPPTAATTEPTEPDVSTKNPVKRKGSMSKIVAVLGEISNVARLRPQLPSQLATQDKKAKRGPFRAALRSKENVVRTV